MDGFTACLRKPFPPCSAISVLIGLAKAIAFNNMTHCNSVFDA
ncbi:hypothetical protein [Alteromonas sp. MTD1]